jgi:hypothetical protein
MIFVPVESDQELIALAKSFQAPDRSRNFCACDVESPRLSTTRLVWRPCTPFTVAPPCDWPRYTQRPNASLQRPERASGQARMAAAAVARRLLREAPSRAWIDMPSITVV